MWAGFFLLASLWDAAIGVSEDKSNCAADKSVCLGNGDHGAVFVFHQESKKYEAICHDNWDKVDADVACREAGFPRGALQETRGQDSGGLVITMNEFDCTGVEKHLIACKHKERRDCMSNQAAGAVCDSVTEEELIHEKTLLQSCFASKVSYSKTDQIGDPTYRSTSEHCQRTCAENVDCVQFSFRSLSKSCHLYSASSKESNPYEVGGPPHCPTESNVAKLESEECQNKTCLVGGRTKTEGNVFHKGRAICDDHWGELEASVVCRELGQNGQVLRFTSASSFGLVPKPQTGSAFKCNGTEEKLRDCAQVPSLIECDSGEGAGVVCDTRSAEVVAKERDCFVRRVAYQGKSGRSLPLPERLLNTLNSAADCQEICKSTTGCSHFTWFYSGGKCHGYNFVDIQGEY